MLIKVDPRGREVNDPLGKAVCAAGSRETQPTSLVELLRRSTLFVLQHPGDGMSNADVALGRVSLGVQQMGGRSYVAVFSSTSALESLGPRRSFIRRTAGSRPPGDVVFRRLVDPQSRCSLPTVGQSHRGRGYRSRRRDWSAAHRSRSMRQINKHLAESRCVLVVVGLKELLPMLGISPEEALSSATTDRGPAQLGVRRRDDQLQPLPGRPAGHGESPKPSAGSARGHRGDLGGQLHLRRQWR